MSMRTSIWYSRHQSNATIIWNVMLVFMQNIFKKNLISLMLDTKAWFEKQYEQTWKSIWRFIFFTSQSLHLVCAKFYLSFMSKLYVFIFLQNVSSKISHYVQSATKSFEKRRFSRHYFHDSCCLVFYFKNSTVNHQSMKIVSFIILKDDSQQRDRQKIE